MDPGEQFVRDVLAQYPDDWETRCELIDTLGRRGDVAEAVSVIEEAPELPIDSGHLYKLVEIYAQGKSNVAVALLRGILANDPDDPKAHLAFADVYATLGNGAKAREHYRTCLRLRPEFRDIALERRIGVNANVPTVRLVSKEQLLTSRNQKADASQPRAHPDLQRARAAGQPSSPAPNGRCHPREKPQRNDTKMIALVIIITLLAALTGGILIWQFR